MVKTQNVTHEGRLAWPLQDLASRLGVSVGFLRLEAQRHRLRIARLGRRVVVLDTEVQRYLAAATQEGPEREGARQ